MLLSEFWDKVTAHFSTPESLARIQVMTKIASQTGGWYKAEMMFLMERLREVGLLQSWDREYSTRYGAKKVDFKIQLGDGTVIVDLYEDINVFM